MILKTHVFNLKSKYPFKISHGTRTETKTFVVELSEGNLTGLGEATPVPYYGVTTEIMEELINENLKFIQDLIFNHPADLWSELNPKLGHNPFVQCAIDIAAYDLWAQKQQLPLYKALGLILNNIPVSDYTIGIDEIPVMIQKIKEFDFPIYKIKLGTSDDLEIIKALRNETKAIFRVDANTAWTPDQTVKYSYELSKMGVEFIEQPLKADNIEGMKFVIKNSELPIIADESCILESDVEKCGELFNGINIKLAKCGGITPALRMIKKARQLKLKVMVGCMTESSIGISAIAQLLPLIDYVDMDGSLLISNDPAEGVFLKDGKAVFPDRNGIGAVLKNIY